MQHTEHPTFYGEDNKTEDVIKSEFSSSQALEMVFHDLFSFIQLGDGQSTEKKIPACQWDAAKLYLSQRKKHLVLFYSDSTFLHSSIS